MQHMRKPLFLSALGLLVSIVCCKKDGPASTPQTTRSLNFTKAWSKVNGGSSYDHYWSGTGTADGGYIAVGYTASTDGDISGLKGQTDALIVKYDAAGNKTWQLLIGGSDQDYATAVHQLPDGNYIGVGYGASNDGDMAGNHGGMDALVFKLSGSGAIQWVKPIGGPANEAARSMVVNTDGTFILAGSRPNAGSAATDVDGWICKLDQSGNVLWEKSYGGSNIDNVASIVADGNGGYLFAGYSSSTDGDVTGNNGGAANYWLVKIDGAGNRQWHKTYGGSGVDWAHDVVKTTNGYVVTGRSTSNDGDVTGQHGGSDAWVICIDKSGAKRWQQAFGGLENDYGQGIWRTGDGGLFIGVNALSANGSFPASLGYMDAWVVKLDENGGNLGQKALGGSGNDEIFGFAGNNHSYCLLGATNSSDGDMNGYQIDFSRNGWILKFQDQ
jgi:hypothetical protein